MIKAIYPGSFDPPTLGHLDIIRRASRIFQGLVIGVVANPSKRPLFTLEERVALLKKDLKSIKNITIVSFDGLLVDCVKQLDCSVIVRGLRFISDFENEFQMALINKKLYPKLETMFIFTDEKYSYISSNSAKEIASFGGEISGLVTENVRQALLKKRKKLIGGRNHGHFTRYPE